MMLESLRLIKASEIGDAAYDPQVSVDDGDAEGSGDDDKQN